MNNKFDNLIADFNIHEKCFLVWPYRNDLWVNDTKNIRRSFKKLLKIISKYESVTVIVDPDEIDTCKKYLSKVDCNILEIPNDDIWIRDTGPIFLKDENDLLAISCKFNGWGNIYKHYAKDDELAEKLCKEENIDITKVNDIVLEGGALQTDGNGTVILTESSILDANRNPNINKYKVETLLKKYFHVKKVIWLDKGLQHDETNGHVDNVLQFCNAKDIIMSWTDDKNNENYKKLNSIYNLIKNESNCFNEKFNVHKLHLPRKNRSTKLPMTYVNLYIGNGFVVFPKFKDKVFDRKAKKVLQSVFPERKVIGMNSLDFICGGGNIHCMTLGLPLLN